MRSYHRKWERGSEVLRGTQGFLVLLVIAVLAATVTAGAQEEKPLYRDGRFIGLSDASRHGYVMAVVTVDEGVVAAVRLTEMNGFGQPKPPDYAWDAYHEAMDVLPERFVEANGVDVDGVVGATSTWQKSKQAVARALAKAGDPEAGRYFDGTFFGRSPADDHGYGTALVTIKNDQIVAVNLDEVLADNSWKNWDTYPHEVTVQARQVLAERFVEADSHEVDMIVGATGSSQKWVAAVRNALQMAQK